MKTRTLVSLLCTIVSVPAGAVYAGLADSEGRWRVCVLTDLGGDPDDEQSLMRFVTLANMYDVEGIVLAPFLPSERRPDCTPYPRPVYFCVWGGAATLQLAILEIENNWGPWQFTPDEKDRVLGKVRVWSIDGQDFSDPLFFQVEPQRSRFFYVDGDSFFGMHQRGDRSTLSRAWVDEHIRGHGPLGTVGPAITDDGTPNLNGCRRVILELN